jgi:hypothetical protein
VEKNGNQVATFTSILLFALVESVENDHEGKGKRWVTALECIGEECLGLLDYQTFADVMVGDYCATNAVAEDLVVVRKLIDKCWDHGCGTATLSRARGPREEERRSETSSLLRHVCDALCYRGLPSHSDTSEPVYELGRRVLHPDRYLAEDLGPSALEARQCSSVRVVKSGHDRLQAIKESCHQMLAVVCGIHKREKRTLFLLSHMAY